MVSQLAAELSHDMQGAVELDHRAAWRCSRTSCEDRSGPPGSTALLARTTRAADRMVRMLDQTMEFGDVGDEPAERRGRPGSSGRTSCVLDSAALLESAGASVEIGDLPVVHADPDDMYSVLQNLLTNSVKFARPDVPPVVHDHASAVADAAGGSRSRDNGVGHPRGPPGRRVLAVQPGRRATSRVTGSAWPRWRGSSRLTAVDVGRGGRSMGGGTEIWFELPGATRTAVTAGTETDPGSTPTGCASCCQVRPWVSRPGWCSR